MAELFANIEVNKDNWWPKLGKLLGGSVAIESGAGTRITAVIPLSSKADASPVH